MRLLMAYFSFALKYPYLKFTRNIVLGLIIVVSDFYRDIFIYLEIIACCREGGFFAIFSYIFAYNQTTINHFKTWFSLMKERPMTHQNHYRLIWKINFIRYKFELLCQIDQFSPNFIWKSGQSGLSMVDSNCLSQKNKSILRNKHYPVWGY